MNYKRYYEALITKQNEQREYFPMNHTFSHRENKYYANAFSYKGYKYNFVISSSRSIAFGKDFIGLIVEIYLDGKYHQQDFKHLLQHKEAIEKELNIQDGDIVWQEMSVRNAVSRIYIKKSVDIEETSQWDFYSDWHIENMIKMLKVLPKFTAKL